MPRQSTAALSLVTAQVLVRIEPPDGLSEAERALWLAVVDSKPNGWFGQDTAPLLTEYVRAKCTCDALDVDIKAAKAADEKPMYLRLLHQRDKESKRLVSIGTKLRLTQQSRYTPKAAATAASKVGAAGGRPWAARS